MTLKIQVIISVVLLIGMIYIIGLIRKHRLELKYSLTWLAVALLVWVMVLVPDFMEWLADIVGIASPINMVFFFGFLFSLVIILSLTVAMSSTSNGVKRLVQQVALLEKKNRELEKKVKELEKE